MFTQILSPAVVGVNCCAALPFALLVHVLFFHIFTIMLADGIIQSRGA
jgi:hypothetical protein